MILLTNLSYSQYPIIKKIGEDSVVLITIKQGEDINKKFIENKKKLDLLKDSVFEEKKKVDSLRYKYDSLNSQLIPLIRKHDEYKHRYEERLKMPVKYPYHDDGWDFAQKLVLIGIIVVQFTSSSFK
jgi:uncharacterized coiled-coil DUF342 family protein